MSPDDPDRMICAGPRGRLEFGRSDVLQLVHKQLRTRQREGRSTKGWEAVRAEVEALEPAEVTDCSGYLSLPVADLLERGSAVVHDDSRGAQLERIEVHYLQWEYGKRGAPESLGNRRVYTVPGGRFRLRPYMQGCGPDCLFQRSDAMAHVSSVL